MPFCFCGLTQKYTPAAHVLSFRVNTTLISILLFELWPPSRRHSCHFSSHCSIHLWYSLQICWTVSVSCFLSFLSVSFWLASLLSHPPPSPHWFLPLIYSFGLLSVRLLNFRVLCRAPPPPSPPHSTLLFPPMFPLTDSQHSFLSPPLCHPSIKTPTDGPEPSAQATFCPSFFAPALHAKRRPIKVRLLSSSTPLFFSLCVCTQALWGH